MKLKWRELVRAVLPVVPLAFCPGCGGGSGTASEQPSSVDAPAPPAPSGNRAPTVSGEPAEYARVGTDYEFQPVWSDPDGDSLEFTATNLPPWAHLDSTTGKITGKPTTTNLGAYESISISAADASHTVSTRAFTITVIGLASGVASLEWPTPVSKVDGSMLDDLAGFRILYGRDADDLDHSVWIASPTAHSYEFATLDDGTWYFAIVAVNASGLEGPATTPARKII